MRVHEVIAGASSSKIVDIERSITEGAVIAVNTTAGVPTSEGTGSEEPDSPSC